MTKEQEEVIAAIKQHRKDYPDDYELGNPYASTGWKKVAAKVRALEESEKPKPKVWTCDPNQTEIRCSNGDVLRAEHLRLNNDPQNSVARALVCCAMNAYEESRRKLLIHCCDIECVRHGCNKCCTCKST